MTSGTPSIVTQRSWTCWRVVMSAMFRPDSPRDLAEEPHLRRGHDAVGHADAHHEVARAWAGAWKTPTHLRRSLSSSRDGLPALAGEADEVVRDVEPVLLGLERLDLVHRARPRRGGQRRIGRSRTAQALSSGWLRERIARGSASGCWRPCRSRSRRPQWKGRKQVPSRIVSLTRACATALPRREVISTKSPSWMPARRASRRLTSRMRLGRARRISAGRLAGARQRVPVIAHAARRERQREVARRRARRARRARRRRSARGRRGVGKRPSV